MAEIKELVAFIAENGFIWGPSPEIYGGVGGFYDYGPLGKLLKNNVEDSIRKVFQKYAFFEVECPTIMPSIVWQASGHLGKFSDPMIQCSKCNSDFRVDKIIEETINNVNAGAMTVEEQLDIIEKHGIKCSQCGSPLKKEITRQSLMMKTQIGVGLEAYNRPETATTTYLPFKRYDEFFRKRYPFAVFQIGKAYRNEISPRQSVMRGREFTQAEGQMFIFKDQKENYAPFEIVADNKLPLWFNSESAPIMTSLREAISYGKLKNRAYAWTLSLAYELFIAMGIPSDRIRLRQHAEDEKAFYADDAWDIEILLNSYGWYEVCGIHDRTDYDLTQHAQFSKQKLDAFNEKTGQREIPHVLEIAFGTDRPTFALMDQFFDYSDPAHLIFRIPKHMAPIKVCVFPLVNKLEEKARDVFSQVQPLFISQFDKSGSIGRRYARADEIGVPICVTVDFDEGLTLRERDSGKQIRIGNDEIVEKLNLYFKGEPFENLGEPVVPKGSSPR